MTMLVYLRRVLLHCAIEHHAQRYDGKPILSKFRYFGIHQYFRTGEHESTQQSLMLVYLSNRCRGSAGICDTKQSCLSTGDGPVTALRFEIGTCSSVHVPMRPFCGACYVPTLDVFYVPYTRINHPHLQLL